MNFRYITLLIIISLVLIIASANLDVETVRDPNKDIHHELQLVHVIWRHGDRNPEWAYPNDPYKSPSFWPDGFGQLTQEGVKQHQELGKYLRYRYDGFIQKHYDPREVYIQSSNINRTILSAKHNSKAFYKSMFKNKDVTNVSNSIPVIQIPQNEDNKLMMVSAACPKRDKLFNDFIANSTLIRDIKSKNAWLFDYLTLHSGTVVDSLYELNQLYNIFYIQKLKNFTLPEWTKKVFPGGIMEELAKFSFKTTTYTDELKTLRGGPLFKEILTHMTYKIKGRAGAKYRKLFTYSAHDTTLTTMMDLMGVFDIHIPSYASALIIELKRHSSLESGYGNGGYFIDILYRNDSRREPYVLHPPGCPEPSCDFKTFRDLYKKFVPNNWSRDCLL